MKPILALALLSFVFAAPKAEAANYVRHRYEAILDFADLGIGTGSYRLEIEMDVFKRPASETTNYVWKYNEPYGFSEFRCETNIAFNGGKSHVRVTDQSTGKVLQDYYGRMETAIANFYVVPTRYSPCRPFWPGVVRSETVLAPQLQPIPFNGQDINVYFYGANSFVEGHKSGPYYQLDRFQLKAGAPGPILVRYGSPYNLVREIPVSVAPSAP